MVRLIVILLLLVGCENKVDIPNPCNTDMYSITWDKPDLDGEIGTKFYLSKDNINWTLVYEVEPQNLNSNGIHDYFDTCQPMYWYVMMYDNHDNRSYEGGCLGRDCKRVKIPTSR